MSKPNTVSVYGRYELSKKELDEIAKQTALIVQQKDQLQEEKRNTVATLSSQIKDLEQQLSSLAQCTREGAEWRYLECRVEYDVTRGVKEYFWVHDDRFIKDEPMTAQEIAERKQLRLSWDINNGDGEF